LSYGFKSCINTTTRFNILTSSSFCIDHIFFKDNFGFDSSKGYKWCVKIKNIITDNYTTILKLNGTKDGDINMEENAEKK